MADIDIVKLIYTELGKPHSLIAFVKDRLGHDRRYAIDATRIRTELNWSPSVSFEQGIKELSAGIARTGGGGRLWKVRVRVYEYVNTTIR